MTPRTVEDRLREEYFALVPEIRRVTEYLDAVTRYHLLHLSRDLQKFEQLNITSRVKDCESAISKLRGKQEGAVFDPDKTYTLTDLRDLAGVRVLAFPSSRIEEIDVTLRSCGCFDGWEADPVIEGKDRLALKYFGCSDAVSKKVSGEYQIVHLLTGLFWDVEHSAVYKAIPQLRGVEVSLEMQRRIVDVHESLSRFEEEFENLVRRSYARV